MYRYMHGYSPGTKMHDCTCRHLYICCALHVLSFHLECHLRTYAVIALKKGSSIFTYPWKFSYHGSYNFFYQDVYHTTHQCFYSRRSLYLALFRLTDGSNGVNELEPWLRNVQVRQSNEIYIYTVHVYIMYMYVYMWHCIVN